MSNDTTQTATVAEDDTAKGDWHVIAGFHLVGRFTTKCAADAYALTLISYPVRISYIASKPTRCDCIDCGCMEVA